MEQLLTKTLRQQGSSHLGARNERDGHADQSGPPVERTLLQPSSTRGSRCHGVNILRAGKAIKKAWFDPDPDPDLRAPPHIWDITLPVPSLQNQRRPRQVLEGSGDGTQPASPVPLHPAPLGLHTPDRAAAPPQEDRGVPHLQEHSGPPEDLLLLCGGRRLGQLK